MPRNRVEPILFKEIPKDDINEKGFVTQLNYFSEMESLSPSHYPNKLICKCGNARYFRNQDKRQIRESGSLCKPCLHKKRSKKRQLRLKTKIIRAALKESIEM